MATMLRSQRYQQEVVCRIGQRCMVPPALNNDSGPTRMALLYVLGVKL